MAGTNGSQGPVVVGICVAFAALTFIVLALRLFARIFVLRQMGIDDCKQLFLTGFTNAILTSPQTSLLALVYGKNQLDH